MPAALQLQMESRREAVRASATDPRACTKEQLLRTDSILLGATSVKQRLSGVDEKGIAMVHLRTTLRAIRAQYEYKRVQCRLI
jgi:hypothetical protein